MEKYKLPKIIYILEWDKEKEDSYVWKLSTRVAQKEVSELLDVRIAGKNVFVCHHDNLAELIEANAATFKEEN